MEKCCLNFNFRLWCHKCYKFMWFTLCRVTNWRDDFWRCQDEAKKFQSCFKGKTQQLKWSACGSVVVIHIEIIFYGKHWFCVYSCQGHQCKLFMILWLEQKKLRQEKSKINSQKISSWISRDLQSAIVSLVCFVYRIMISTSELPAPTLRSETNHFNAAGTRSEFISANVESDLDWVLEMLRIVLKCESLKIADELLTIVLTLIWN